MMNAKTFKLLVYNVKIDIIEKNKNNYNKDDKMLEKLRIENESVKIINNMKCQ